MRRSPDGRATFARQIGVADAGMPNRLPVYRNNTSCISSRCRKGTGRFFRVSQSSSLYTEHSETHYAVQGIELHADHTLISTACCRALCDMDSTASPDFRRGGYHAYPRLNIETILTLPPPYRTNTDNKISCSLPKNQEMPMALFAREEHHSSHLRMAIARPG